MIGGIYSDQTCPQCGSRFRDDRATGLYCPRHRHQQATRFVVRFGKLTKRFRSYERAFKFLNGVRHETDMGRFDIRDYRRDNPLGFANLAGKWLDFKRSHLKRKSWNGLNNYTSMACELWQNRNVKEIGRAEIRDFLLSLTTWEGKPASSKTRANARSCLHDFYTWLVEEDYLQLHQMPKFPKVSYTLGLRRTITKDDQDRMLDEIRRMSWDVNPRIWLGVRWLCTYINLRPGELLNIREADIDLKQGLILIPHPKEKDPKFVFLLPADVELVKSMAAGFPQMNFFRHTRTRKGVRAGTPFGPRYLWKWWKKACVNLGIEGVDLYGGTRHSSVIDLRKRHSPEAIRRATMHRTNAAFERYLQLTAEELRPIYADARTDNALITLPVSERAENV